MKPIDIDENGTYEELVSIIQTRISNFKCFNENNYYIAEHLRGKSFKSKLSLHKELKNLIPRSKTIKSRLSLLGYTDEEITEYQLNFKEKAKERGKIAVSSGKSKSNSQFCIEYWTNKGLTEEEAKEKISSIQSKNSKKVKNTITHFSHSYWTNKGFTDEEAKEKISTIQREGSKRRKEYWIKHGYSLEEAKGKVSEHQRENSKKYLLKYTSIERRKFNRLCKEYWLEKGLIEEEIELQLSKNGQTFSLEICIEKYGEDLGTQIWTDRQLNWVKSFNNKSDKEIERIHKSKCSKWHNKEYKGLFYVIEIESNLCKIGITSKSNIDKRYKYGTRKKYKHHTINFDSIVGAYKFEQHLLKIYSNHIKHSDYGMFGWTETINNKGFEQLKTEINEHYDSFRN